MKCANHPLNDAFVYCGQCGRSLCNDCKREVGGMVYCENCLTARLHTPLSPLGSGTGPSPGVALALGFIPGVGAAYCGLLAKGFVQVLIFVALWAGAQRLDPLGWLVAAFWVYLAIDSYQTAKRMQLGQPAQEWFGLGHKRFGPVVGAVALVILGGLLQLEYLNIHVFRYLDKFWPVLLIVVGFLLLQRRFGGHKPEVEVTPVASEKPPEGPSNIPGSKGL